MQIFHSPFLKILFARKHGKSQRIFRRSGAPKPEKLRHTVNNLSNAPNNIRLFDKPRKKRIRVPLPCTAIRQARVNSFYQRITLQNLFCLIGFRENGLKFDRRVLRYDRHELIRFIKGYQTKSDLIVPVVV